MEPNSDRKGMFHYHNVIRPQKFLRIYIPRGNLWTSLLSTPTRPKILKKGPKKERKNKNQNV